MERSSYLRPAAAESMDAPFPMWAAAADSRKRRTDTGNLLIVLSTSTSAFTPGEVEENQYDIFPCLFDKSGALFL
jgi:hypothetical protein